MIHRFLLTFLTIAQMTVMASGVVFATTLDFSTMTDQAAATKPAGEDHQWNLEDVERHKKECNDGDVKMCNLLGYMHELGRGVKQDVFMAVELYRKACNKRDGDGCVSLGDAYRVGRGVRQSDSDALDFYGKACDLKAELGCTYYARVKGKMKW